MQRAAVPTVFNLLEEASTACSHQRRCCCYNNDTSLGPSRAGISFAVVADSYIRLEKRCTSLQVCNDCNNSSQSKVGKSEIMFSPVLSPRRPCRHFCVKQLLPQYFSYFCTRLFVYTGRITSRELATKIINVNLLKWSCLSISLFFLLSITT